MTPEQLKARQRQLEIEALALMMASQPQNPMQARIEAARAGTLQMQPGSAERAAAADMATGIIPSPWAAPSPPPATSVLEQAGAGTTEGLASLFGMPSRFADATTDALTAGINAATGLDLSTSKDLPPELQNRIGTPERFVSDAQAMGVMPEAMPQNASQRYARRVGQEVGYGAPLALATGGLSAGASTGKVLAANTAADISAGLAGNSARELFPESDTADILATILGGGATAMALSSGRTRPPRQYETSEDAAAAAGKIYGEPGNPYDGTAPTGLYAGNAGLSRDAQEELIDRLWARFRSAKGNKKRHSNAYSVLTDARKNPIQSVMDIEELRRVIGDDVASKPDEARIGVLLKKEVDTFLDRLKDQPGRLVGDNPIDDILDLFKARRLSHQASKARKIESGTKRALNRAATSGRGGNAINTMRQNVRAIYDTEIAPLKPGQRSGFTPDEVGKMHDIVHPGTAMDMGRHMAGLSPATGALPMMGNIGAIGTGVTGSLLTGSPWPLMTAGPAIAGSIAKGATERATGKQIDDLLDTILRGGKAVPKVKTPTKRAGILSWLLSQGDLMQ